MPDIAMCPNETCPIRFGCRRSPASGTEPSSRQSWMDFKWERDGSGEPACDHFWPLVPPPERSPR